MNEKLLEQFSSRFITLCLACELQSWTLGFRNKQINDTTQIHFLNGVAEVTFEGQRKK